MKISIIIPIYNVSEYVERCFDSIVAQNHSNIECIIVDDYGTDDSMDIVRKKLANYSGDIDFKIVCHETNRGLSAARNTGLDIARGEYVMFVDSDDRLRKNCIGELVKLIDTHQPDMLCFRCEEIFEDDALAAGRRPVSSFDVPSEKCTPYSGFDFFKKILNSESCLVMAWLYVSRRQFFKNNSLRFIEGIVHEDLDFTHRAVILAEQVIYFDKVCYEYFRRLNSITLNNDLINHRILSYQKVILSLMEFIGSSKLPEEISSLISERIAEIARVAIRLCINNFNERSLDQILLFLKKNRVRLFVWSRKYGERQTFFSVAEDYARLKMKVLKFKIGQFLRKHGNFRLEHL